MPQLEEHEQSQRDQHQLAQAIQAVGGRIEAQVDLAEERAQPADHRVGQRTADHDVLPSQSPSPHGEQHIRECDACAQDQKLQECAYGELPGGNRVNHVWRGRYRHEGSGEPRRRQSACDSATGRARHRPAVQRCLPAIRGYDRHGDPSGEVEPSCQNDACDSEDRADTDCERDDCTQASHVDGCAGGWQATHPSPAGSGHSRGHCAIARWSRPEGRRVGHQAGGRAQPLCLHAVCQIPRDSQGWAGRSLRGGA